MREVVKWSHHFIFQTTAFHSRKKKKGDDSIEAEAKCSFSVITHHGTLDFIAGSEHERELWVRILTLLQPSKQGIEGDAYVDKFGMYVMEQWKRADMDRDGSLSVQECVMLLRKMNYEVAKKQIKTRMKDKAELSFEDFQNFMKEMMGNRPEITLLIKEIRLRYASSKNANKGPRNESENLSMDELLFFLNVMQRLPREKEVSREHVISTYFSGEKISDSITVIQFAKILDHSKNSVIDPVSTSQGCGGKVRRAPSHRSRNAPRSHPYPASFFETAADPRAPIRISQPFTRLNGATTVGTADRIPHPSPPALHAGAARELYVRIPQSLLDQLEPQHVPHRRPAARHLLGGAVLRGAAARLPLRGARLLGRRERRPGGQRRQSAHHHPRPHALHQDPLQRRHQGAPRPICTAATTLAPPRLCAALCTSPHRPSIPSSAKAFRPVLSASAARPLGRATRASLHSVHHSIWEVRPSDAPPRCAAARSGHQQERLRAAGQQPVPCHPLYRDALQPQVSGSHVRHLHSGVRGQGAAPPRARSACPPGRADCPPPVCLILAHHLSSS